MLNKFICAVLNEALDAHNEQEVFNKIVEFIKQVHPMSIKVYEIDGFKYITKNYGLQLQILVVYDTVQKKFFVASQQSFIQHIDAIEILYTNIEFVEQHIEQQLQAFQQYLDARVRIRVADVYTLEQMKNILVIANNIYELSALISD